MFPISTSSLTYGLTVYNNILYVVNISPGYVSTYDLSGNVINNNFITGLVDTPAGIFIYNNIIYISFRINHGYVNTYNVTDGTIIQSNLLSNCSYPQNLFINNNILYTALSSSLTTYNINTGTIITNFITGLNNPNAMFILNNTLYIVNHTSGSISTYNATTGSIINNNFITGLNNPNGMFILDNILYVSNNNNYIATYRADSGSIINNQFINLYSANQIWINNYNLYVNNNTSVALYSVPPPACFLYDTKILTNQGYRPIQDLRKGDLVKTLKDNYKPIDMIGKREITHLASQERIKDQLYKCSKEQYPELNEDLVITGCHSILVDSFKSKEQINKTIEINKNLCMTDDKFRLPCCLDDRASVYETPGDYTIYHFALENDNYFSNYGIYANGLLVETASKYDLEQRVF